MSKSNIFKEIEEWNNRMSYATISRSYANSSYVMDEWIKFLSYVSPVEKVLLKEIESKPLYDLLQDEINYYRNLRDQIRMGELFVKYKNRNCTKEEHDDVYEYMRLNSLLDFMTKRLSSEELKAAYILIGGLRNKTIDELTVYIADLESRYEELSLIDAYVLHIARDIKYNKIADETNEKIRKESIEREISLRKSLRRDFGI